MLAYVNCFLVLAPTFLPGRDQDRRWPSPAILWKKGGGNTYTRRHVQRSVCKQLLWRTCTPYGALGLGGSLHCDQDEGKTGESWGGGRPSKNGSVIPTAPVAHAPRSAGAQAQASRSAAQAKNLCFVRFTLFACTPEARGTCTPEVRGTYAQSDHDGTPAGFFDSLRACALTPTHAL